MKINGLNDWLNLAANIGVIGGLIFLAIEINQNNALLRSKTRQSLVANDVASLTANLEHADVFVRLASQGALSAEDQLRLSFMYSLDMRNREFEYFQYMNGVLDEASWQSYQQVIVFNHSTELGKKWWDEIGRGIVDPEFAVIVDALLADAEPANLYKRMSTWADP